MRLTTTAMEGAEHNVTVPRHDPLRLGTLASILDEVAAHFGMSRDELMTKIFNK